MFGRTEKSRRPELIRFSEDLESWDAAENGKVSFKWLGAPVVQPIMKNKPSQKHSENRG